MLIPLPILKARTADGSLIINGKDVLLGLSVQDVSFSYTDNTSDKADNLCVEIADPNRTWMMRYLPGDVKKGIECQGKITITDWLRPLDNRILECGKFWITDVGIKGPPNVVSVKANSIPSNGIKGTKKHRSWENSDLKSIAGQIAKENQLELYWDTNKNAQLKRTDQVDKPDIQYLRDMCKENELSLKIHKGQLVIYSEQEYEARQPAFILEYGIKQILTYDFNSKIEGVHSEAHNSYVNPETGKLTKTKFNPKEETGEGPEAKNAPLLITNESVNNESDAKGGSSLFIPRSDFLDLDYLQDDHTANKGKGKAIKEKSKAKCKAKLREKNKKEHQCSFTVFGSIEYLSGLCCQTKGFGIFDRKWFIESSQHSLSGSGYITTLRLRGALKGY